MVDSGVSEVWTTLKVLDWTTRRFERGGQESARLDAQVLLAHVLRCSRMALYTNHDMPMAPDALSAYRALIERRLAGEPVAYLTGSKEFWSLVFAVDGRVLIPRPDTETLVQVALELGDAIAGEGHALRVAEVATGSGAVAIALAHERAEWTLVATDLSEDALVVAQSNSESNGVTAQVKFLPGHLLEPLASHHEEFSLLVSNLPYIGEEDMSDLPAEVLCEPRLALCGGQQGTELISELVAGVSLVLAPGGWVALEHGFDQAAAVREIASEAGYCDVSTRDDLEGRARVTSFRSAPAGPV